MAFEILFEIDCWETWKWCLGILGFMIISAFIGWHFGYDYCKDKKIKVKVR